MAILDAPFVPDCTSSLVIRSAVSRGQAAQRSGSGYHGGGGSGSGSHGRDGSGSGSRGGGGSGSGSRGRDGSGSGSRGDGDDDESMARRLQAEEDERQAAELARRMEDEENARMQVR